MKESIQSQGGKARSKNLTPEQRSQIAKEAAQTRWCSLDMVKIISRLRRNETELYKAIHDMVGDSNGKLTHAECAEFVTTCSKRLNTLLDMILKGVPKP